MAIEVSRVAEATVAVLVVEFRSRATLSMSEILLVMIAVKC